MLHYSCGDHEPLTIDIVTKFEVSTLKQLLEMSVDIHAREPSSVNTSKRSFKFPSIGNQVLKVADF